MVDQQVDWVSAPPNQGLADAINESIRRHEQRQFELSDIHEVEAGQRNQVSVILVYEK
jgi:hypothetical protein